MRKGERVSSVPGDRLLGTKERVLTDFGCFLRLTLGGLTGSEDDMTSEVEAVPASEAGVRGYEAEGRAGGR